MNETRISSTGILHRGLLPGGAASARLIRDASETCHSGAPHALAAAHQDRSNAALPAFLRA